MTTSWINDTALWFNDTVLNINDTDFNRGSLTDNPTYRLAITLLIWILPIIIVVGALGNIFSFILMLQREMRHTSTYFYLAVLAIADTLVLFVSAFKTWIRTWSNFELLHISDASCKTLMFLTYFSLHLSAWLVVAVTLERFIVVWFPLKATTICSTTRAKLTILFLMLALFLLNVHLFWTAELVIDPETGAKECAMLRDYDILYKEVVPWLHFTVYSFIPFATLLIFNILIIVSLIRHRQMITHQMTKDDRRTQYHHRKLAITLLCISFVWIFTTTPSALYTVLPLKPQTMDDRAKLLLVKIICYLIMYVNHSINFLLYCITGRNFRYKFSRLLRGLCQHRRRPTPKLTFKANRSGSGQDTSFPLTENMYFNRGSKSLSSVQFLTFHTQFLASNTSNNSNQFH